MRLRGCLLLIFIVLMVSVLFTSSSVYAFELGGVLEIAIPQIIPDTVEGYQYFNYFFGLPMCIAVIVVPLMVLIMVVNRS